MPLTVEQFTQRLTSSGVMSAEQLRESLALLATDLASFSDGEQLARELVKHKKLTKFQAEQLYAGKGNSLTLGNYVILDKLGQGGMRMVLKAEHKRLKRLVAIKVMSPTAVKTPDSLKRFHREVEAAAKLRHPNVVATDDADEAKGTHFLVMEYVDGSDLSALVKKHGPLPVEQALQCIIQAARGLEFAHEQGVIHRDIKPANLLIDAKGTVKILDMGLARIDGAVGGSSEGAGLTSTGTIMGTVDYMSPEQAMDTKHADARSDIYSLGCTLYYLLTGKVVYGGDTMMKKLMAHQNGLIPQLSRELRDERREQDTTTLDSQLSSLNSVFRRMVAKRPEDRPQSMTQVIAELERCLSGGSPTVVFERSEDSATASGVSSSGNELQDFLRQISGEGGVSTTSAAPTGSKGTVVTPSAAEAETMISAAGDGGTDPRTEQTLTVERSRLQASQAANRGKKSRTMMFGSVAAAVVVLLAIAFAVRGKSGTLHLEITDELIEVTIDDTGSVVKGKKTQNFRVPFGQHVLHVKREDLSFDTDPFEVAKGEPISIKVERVGRNIRAMQGKTLLGSQGPPSSTSHVSTESSPKTSVAIKKRAGKFEVAGPDYQAKVNSDGLLEKLEVGGTTLIETTNFGGGDNYGRIGLGGFVTAKQSDTTLVFQQARDYQLKYVFDADGFTVRAQVSEAAAKRDAVDGKSYFLFYEVRFSNEATRVRPLDGSDEFPLPADMLKPTFRFAVAFKNGTELEVSSPPSDALFNHHGEPYRWSHGHLALDTDNIFRFDIRKSSAAPVSKPALAVAPFDAKQARGHQEAWAKHLGVPVEYTNSIGMKFVLIPPGEFVMGSTPEEVEAALKGAGEDKNLQDAIKNEAPRHKVILTEPIYLGVNEVTQREYEAVIGNNPSGFAKTGTEAKEAERVAGLDTANFPVEGVTWYDAAEFCAKLSQREKLKPYYARAGDTVKTLDGTGYRLPTEAQWEFACRAGTTTRCWIGDKDEDLAKAGWFGADGRTHSVGELQANPLGLNDMYGNVWEMVEDAWDPTYYGQSAEKPAINPAGPPPTGSTSTVRGGCWFSRASECRSSARSPHFAGTRLNFVGFRVTLAVDAVKEAIKKSPPPAVAPFDAQQARAHQEVWAKHLGTTVETTNSVGQKMILIPPGEFLMGSSDKQIEAALKVADEIKGDQGVKDRIEKAELPQHKFIIKKSLLFSTTEVTIGQFKKFAAATSYQTEAEKAEIGTKAAPPTVEAGQTPPKPIQTYLNPGYVASDDLPAAFITWNDAVAYCTWLSEREKTTYRLPTEAEWEYACRAGTTTQYSFGDDYNELAKYGWHNKNAGGKSHPVGTLLPNNFGLFDMHGNLYEWCGDYFDEKWYSTSPPNDPSAGSPRVVRGGNWSNHASYCRSASRAYSSPSYRHYNYGFRCVAELRVKSATESKQP